MNIDVQKRYTTATEFFELHGSVLMKLAADAALEVCMKAAEHGLIVSRIEGGKWHNPGFEARVDCIWDGVSPYTTLKEAIANNLKAMDFIASEQDEHDTFIVTVYSMGDR
jgi:hypothetical protein